MKDTPVATFLMTAYNSAAYIHESIASVLGQDEKDFVFIIIDDASIDTTPEIIASFKDPRIKYIRNKKNLHIALAANAGLRLVNTKYVLRIDSDDICLPKRLSTQLQFMESHPEIDVCGSSIEFFDNEKGTWKMPLTDAAIKARMLWDNVIANSSVIVRMETLKSHHLEYTSKFQFPPFEDYELWIKMLPFARFHNLNQILVRKREYAESQSELHNKKANEQLENFYKWVFVFFNFTASENETTFHILDKKPDIKITIELLVNYKAWLIKLLTHFSSNPIFEKKELNRVVERKWKTIGNQIPLKDVFMLNKYLSLSKGFADDNALAMLKRRIK